MCHKRRRCRLRQVFIGNAEHHCIVQQCYEANAEQERYGDRRTHKGVGPRLLDTKRTTVRSWARVQKWGSFDFFLQQQLCLRSQGPGPRGASGILGCTTCKRVHAHTTKEAWTLHSPALSQIVLCAQVQGLSGSPRQGSSTRDGASPKAKTKAGPLKRMRKPPNRLRDWIGTSVMLDDGRRGVVETGGHGFFDILILDGSGEPEGLPEGGP